MESPAKWRTAGRVARRKHARCAHVVSDVTLFPMVADNALLVTAWSSMVCLSSLKGTAVGVKKKLEMRAPGHLPRRANKSSRSLWPSQHTCGGLRTSILTRYADACTHPPPPLNFATLLSRGPASLPTGALCLLRWSMTSFERACTPPPVLSERSETRATASFPRGDGGLPTGVLGCAYVHVCVFVARLASFFVTSRSRKHVRAAGCHVVTISQ